MSKKKKNNPLSFILSMAFESLRALKFHPKSLMIAALCDTLFFVIYGFVRAPLFNKISEYIVIIGAAITEGAATLVRGTNPTMSSIIANDQIASAYTNKLIILYAILALSVYLIYTFFHSVSWKMSKDIIGEKIGMYQFIKEFSFLTIFWFALFIVYYIIDFSMELRQAALQSIQAESSIGYWAIAIQVSLFVIIYFGLISYTLIGKHSLGKKLAKSLGLGITKIHYFVPCIALISAIFYMFNFVLIKIGTINPYAMMGVGILTIIPAMTWARIYLNVVSKKVNK